MSKAMDAIEDYVDLLLSPGEYPPPAAPPTNPAPGGPATLAQHHAPGQQNAELPRPGARCDAQDGEVPAAQNGKLARWLRLRCGSQTYALELLKIREVVLPAALLPLRGVNSAVSGVMNLRGQVVPVLDLGLHFDGVPIETTADTRIVVLEERNEVLGLRVSAADDIVLLDETGIEDARASNLAPVGDQRIRGIARLGGQVMLLLDASRLIQTPLH